MDREAMMEHEDMPDQYFVNLRRITQLEVTIGELLERIKVLEAPKPTYVPYPVYPVMPPSPYYTMPCGPQWINTSQSGH